MFRGLDSYQNSSSHYQPKVSWQRTGSVLKVSFLVQGTTWNTNDSFLKTHKRNWGLWDYDVMEVFLQLRNDEQDISKPYFEFQTSPLNQEFSLTILKPRKLYYTPLNLDYEFLSEVSKECWKGDFSINLPELGKFNEVYGNFHLILGRDHKEYYSLNKGKQTKPDFHDPTNFIKL